MLAGEPGVVRFWLMAVGWHRRVSPWYLSSLCSEPPLICRRMCFNRKNQSCPYLRSLAPAGAEWQRWPAGSGHRQRPKQRHCSVGGSCASPAEPGGSVWRLRAQPQPRPRFCNAISALRAQRCSPALPAPLFARLLGVFAGAFGELRQNSAFSHKCSLALAGSPGTALGTALAPGGSTKENLRCASPCRGPLDPVGAAGNPKI